MPPIDPAQERRLLAAFDAHLLHAPRRARLGARSWLAPAALVAAAAIILFAVAFRERPLPAQPLLSSRNPAAGSPPLLAARGVVPAPIVQPPLPSADAPGFVMWPGADELPRFESGQLMRVELPASVVVSLGLNPSRPLRMDGTVQTDVLVGQDGYARAVRLVR
ncbi:MAG TPA: hypothetical protein VEU08_04515 [Vicinamibacterales bacterium]|nr:hypothetical protein [Vicinamibacterales bacterium]